ncbi:hypothetical protein OC861_002195 [Tilletia horrida]|nr:hypothetical protein OC861_002195 [Tilletia horrida]
MPRSLRSSTRSLRATAGADAQGSPSEPGPSRSRATRAGGDAPEDGAGSSTQDGPARELRPRPSSSRVASISTHQDPSQESSNSAGSRSSRRSTRASTATESQPDADEESIDSAGEASTSAPTQQTVRPRRSQRSILAELAAGSGSRSADRSNAAEPLASSSATNPNNAVDSESRPRRVGLEGGDVPSRAIDLDDLLLSSDDDEDFRVVSSHTNPAPPRPTTLEQWGFGTGIFNDARSCQCCDEAAYDRIQETNPNSVLQQQGVIIVQQAPILRTPAEEISRGTYHIIDGIPAGPHRYRHRERAVHFAPGTALGSAAAEAEEAASPEVSVLRRLNFYPSAYAAAGRFGGSEHRRMPEKFEEKWTHPHPETLGFSNSIVEPPIELDADPNAVPTAPLPDTTPICARCRYALQIGGTGDKKVWVLPCGHVIDGKCVRELSDPERKLRSGPPGKALLDAQSKVKDRSKAVTITEPTNSLKRSVSQRDDEEPLPSADTDEEPSAVEPPSKKRHIDDHTSAAPSRGTPQEPIDADVSSQSFEVIYAKVSKRKATVSAVDDDDEPVVSGVNLQPTHFDCPVADCKQPCYPKGEHDLSIIELFL